MDEFRFCAQARTSLAQIASAIYPELAHFFPFRGAINFKAHFGTPNSIAVTDDGALEQTVFVGGKVETNDDTVRQ